MQETGLTDAMHGDDVWQCDHCAWFQGSNPKHTKASKIPRLKKVQKNTETF